MRLSWKQIVFVEVFLNSMEHYLSLLTVLHRLFVPLLKDIVLESDKDLNCKSMTVLKTLPQTTSPLLISQRYGASHVHDCTSLSSADESLLSKHPKLVASNSATFHGVSLYICKAIL